MSVGSFANTWHTSKIKSVYTLRDGNFIIIFQNNAPGCTRGDKYHYVKSGDDGMTDEGVKNLLSLSLSAAAMSKIVKAHYKTESDLCSIDRILVDFN